MTFSVKNIVFLIKNCYYRNTFFEAGIAKLLTNIIDLAMGCKELLKTKPN